MKRYFTLILGALAMVAVALLSAFIAMRLAIHGREVEVPALTGLSVTEASRLAYGKGVALTLESRFYSTDVPAGHILAQDPAPGAHVRRDWQVRITESLGPQRVSIPDLTGQSERAASVSIRRLSLDLGAVAHIAYPGDPGVVIAQTPPSKSGGVDGPRVSLLISDPIAGGPPSAGSIKLPSDPAIPFDLASASDGPAAYVMPSLLGLTYAAASARAYTTGLHVVVLPDAPASPSPAGSPDSGNGSGGPAASPSQAASQLAGESSHQAASAHLSGIVTAQIPQAGRRVVRGDAVRVMLAHPNEQTP
jgi:beta-lactam-binding protein with PASTA domain